MISTALNSIDTQRDNLATNLTAMGVSSTNSETLAQLVPKVLDISVATPLDIYYDSIDADGYLTSTTFYGTSIPFLAFKGKGKLASLTAPNLTIINNDEFNGCIALNLSTIPSGVISIGNTAFYGCTGLNSKFALNSGLTTIGLQAFKNCTSLRKLWIPATVTTILRNTSGSITTGCNLALVVYCEPASQPAGWDYNASITNLTFNWGVTKAQFDAL
jgi:hypothetical protein